ncbi:hypothetical protein AB833_03790 [Chromatiales bacterium (ex Bugula neritina AB1)]|nr:hypothetical protein AB833_03790 [Chromatiales bacterium (ex Bugula neritina AB1)]
MVNGMTKTRTTKTPDNKAGEKKSRIQIQNRQRIISAALEVFSSFGYRGSTVAQISDCAHMSKANVLYYYKSKKEIYIALLEHTLVEWLDPLTSIDPNGDPAEELWSYTRSKLALSKASPEASRLFANEIIQGAPTIRQFLETDLKELVTQKCRVIQQWIDDGKLVAVSPLHLIFFIWACTQHYADFSVQTEILSDSSDTIFSDAEETLKTLLLNGLLPR